MFTRLHTTSGFLTFVVVLLSRVCLSECPFLYDIVDGSWKISLSNGCWFIKCHLLIRISLMFRTVEWNCVITKGKIRFFFLEEGPFTSFKFYYWEWVVNEVFQVVSLSARYVSRYLQIFLLKELLLRNHNAFSLTKPSFAPSWWHVVENLYRNVSVGSKWVLT